MTENSSACEKLPIVTIPITLKPLTRIVLFLQIQKFFELRIARDDLLWFREFVIRQVITPAARYRQIDQSPERTRRRLDATRCMKREQIENDTGVGLLGPCKKALVIFFDQSDGAVDDGCAIRAQQICCLR